MIKKEIKEQLDYYVEKYNTSNFIKEDPISLVHRFSRKEDIEIIGLIMATISWGNRKSIIKSSRNIMNYMDNSPYDFIMNHSKEDLIETNKSIHRTFNMIDLNYFIISLKNIYKNHGGIEDIIYDKKNGSNIQERISSFKKIFFSLNYIFNSSMVFIYIF